MVKALRSIYLTPIFLSGGVALVFVSFFFTGSERLLIEGAGMGIAISNGLQLLWPMLRPEVPTRSRKTLVRGIDTMVVKSCRATRTKPTVQLKRKLARHSSLLCLVMSLSALVLEKILMCYGEEYVGCAMIFMALPIGVWLWLN